ncbi:MAG: sulfatase-like hydrolase/transferase, partial [Chloroflexota bacterium]
MPYFVNDPIRKAQDPNAKNILIMLFDALSAKNINLYGYPRETMPNLSKLAEKATVYHNHMAGGPFTTPATASLLTGTYPWSHRAIKLMGQVMPYYDDRNIFSLFDEYYRVGYTHNALAQNILKSFLHSFEDYKARQDLFLEPDFLASEVFANDFDIASISNLLNFSKQDRGFANSLFLSELRERFLKAKFNKYAELYPRGLPYILQDRYYILEDAIDWIISRLQEIPNPFLSYFHLLPPHEPYRTRVDFVNAFQGDGYKPIEKPKHLFRGGFSQQSLNEMRLNYDEYI